MDIYVATEQAYKNGYEAGIKAVLNKLKEEASGSFFAEEILLENGYEDVRYLTNFSYDTAF